MPKSIRHQYAARLAAKSSQAPTREYETCDPQAKPDAAGNFAGVRARKQGNKLIVRLTEAQAKFYLDQGTIKLVSN